MLGEEHRGHSFKIRSRISFVSFNNFRGYVEIFAANAELLFEGELVNGVRQGYGIEYDGKGKALYEGEFADDLYNGWGIAGNYCGEFKCGYRDGWGVYKGRISYEGYWKQDKPNGIGIMNVEKKDIKEFLGRTTLAKGNEERVCQYVGEWAMGQLEGSGKLMSPNGIYIGDFVAGLYDGEGTLITSSGVETAKYRNGLKSEH